MPKCADVPLRNYSLAQRFENKLENCFLYHVLDIIHTANEMPQLHQMMPGLADFEVYCLPAGLVHPKSVGGDAEY